MFKKYMKKIGAVFMHIGQQRANAELRRMGYTEERLRALGNENLKNWV